MGVSRVAGHPDYTSAGTSKFIPEVWSSKILKKFYTQVMATAICNTDHEGEIKGGGDKIYIRTIPDITIFNYQKGMALPKQRPESPDVEMVIDKGKGWNILLDDVDKVQSDIDLLNKFTGDAAQQLKINVDSDLFSGIASDLLAVTAPDAGVYNFGATAGKITAGFDLGVSGTPKQLTKTNVIDLIVDCGTVLDENDIPEEGRWLVLPAWAAGMIKKSDVKDAAMMGDPKSIVRTGMIGGIDRFVVYTSNQIATVAAATEASGFKSYYALFGTNDAVSFAAQLTKTESLRSTESFDTIVRGLMVYGYKVLKAQALGCLYVRK
jgi:hypothetical protein